MDSSGPKLSRHHRELKQADGTSLMCFSQWNRWAQMKSAHNFLDGLFYFPQCTRIGYKQKNITQIHRSDLSLLWLDQKLWAFSSWCDLSQHSWRQSMGVLHWWWQIKVGKWVSLVVFVPGNYNLTIFCSDMKRTTGNDNLDLLLVSAFKDKRNQSRFDHCTFGSTLAKD